MKDKLSGKIIEKFAALREKTYSYITENSNEGKRQKEQKSAS